MAKSISGSEGKRGIGLAIFILNLLVDRPLMDSNEGEDSARIRAMVPMGSLAVFRQ
jgi:hypothetical protein